MRARVSRRSFVVLAGLSAVGLAACGGGDAAPAASSTAAPVGPAPGSGGQVTLEVSSAGEDSKFDKEALEAPAGSKITLVFKNLASAESNKLFNWVLTKPGTQLKVVSAGAS
jgi:ABC-type glycerol-3-phosphate transport system substrate-binding protein